LAALSSIALDHLGPLVKGNGMSQKLSPDDRLDREAERIARKVSAILYSFRLVGDGFAGDFPDVSTLWERIGRRLAEYECAASDRGPLGPDPPSLPVLGRPLVGLTLGPMRRDGTSRTPPVRASACSSS
jgi:hypothetical protein